MRQENMLPEGSASERTQIGCRYVAASMKNDIPKSWGNAGRFEWTAWFHYVGDPDGPVGDEKNGRTLYSGEEEALSGSHCADGPHARCCDGISVQVRFPDGSFITDQAEAPKGQCFLMKGWIVGPKSVVPSGAQETDADWFTLTAHES